MQRGGRIDFIRQNKKVLMEGFRNPVARSQIPWGRFIPRHQLASIAEADCLAIDKIKK